MHIDIRNLRAFVLSTGREDRVANLRRLPWTYETVAGPVGEKLIDGSIGYQMLIDRALKQNPFQPFLLLEDDVSVNQDAFEEYSNLIVPDDAEAVYVGTSTYAVLPGLDCAGSPVFGKVANDHVCRVYNMLSTHGILVLTARFAAALECVMLEAALLQKYAPRKPVWDCLTARMQVDYQVYATNKPIVYQDSAVGGQEDATVVNVVECLQEPTKEELEAYRPYMPHFRPT